MQFQSPIPHAPLTAAPSLTAASPSRAQHPGLSSAESHETGNAWAESSMQSPMFPLQHPIQAKLKIGAPDDAYEREADAVAEQVVQNNPRGDFQHPVHKGDMRPGLGNAGLSIQRKCAACGDEEQVQRKPATPMLQAKGAGAGQQVAPHLSQSIAAARHGGSPMEGSARSQMEQGFGQDLGHVRIHHGATAAGLSSALNARAFTLGQDIFFNDGEYNPQSAGGQRLLAHELTHVMQQTGMVHKASPTTPAPMKRVDFDKVMQTTYGVTTIRTGATMEDQVKSMGAPVGSVLPGWTLWDPGTESTAYQDIIDGFAAVDTAFKGFPSVTEIVFYNTYYDYDAATKAYAANGQVGAQFGTTDLTIFKGTTTLRKGLPVARSNSKGEYKNKPIIGLEYSGDPNAAPIDYPSQRLSTLRFIIHELGHGLNQAATADGYAGQKGASDPTMLDDYRKAVGWAKDYKLYDIGQKEVSDAIIAANTPDAKFRITEGNWNDPKWVEQPVSDYMVTGGAGEDFADAVTVFVENPTLLKDRSPHRFEFISSRQSKWLPRLSHPTAAGSAAPATTPAVTPPTTFPLGPNFSPGPIVPRFKIPSLIGDPDWSPTKPDPLGLKLPSLAPDPSLIDWGAIRGEFESRRAPFMGMEDSVQKVWMESFQFYRNVMGLSPAQAAAMTNKTSPRLIGAGLTRDYPSMGEASDRSLNVTGIVLPVSDILKFLITK